MTSQPGKQTVAIHLFLDISISKGTQKMKHGQSIEYNMRNIFLKKSRTKCGREISPRPFSEKPKLIMSLDQQTKVLSSLFLKNKKRSGAILPALFSAWFLKKNVSLVIFY